MHFTIFHLISPFIDLAPAPSPHRSGGSPGTPRTARDPPGEPRPQPWGPTCLRVRSAGSADRDAPGTGERGMMGDGVTGQWFGEVLGWGYLDR